MKTERRHELQTNELADWLGAKTLEIRPYAKLIVGALVLLVLAIFLLSFGAVQRRKNREIAWKELFSFQVNANTADPITRAEYAEKLIDLSKRQAGTQVGAWALQSAGDINLSLGSALMWQDRAEAREKFNLARENYNDALATVQHDILRQRALQGLAQTNEALNKITDAEQNYQQIIDKWPDSAAAKLAADRLAFLQRPSTVEFYDWFMQQKPVPPPMTSNTPGQMPTNQLRDSPSLSLPDPDDLTRPGGTVAPFSVEPPETSLQPAADESGSTDASRGGEFVIEAVSPTDDAAPAAAETAPADETEAANGVP